MIFGGMYAESESQNFWSDNVGITPLIPKQTRRKTFFFDVIFQSEAIPGDS